MTEDERAENLTVASTPALMSAGRPIVILADMEKEEMEEELRNHNIDFLRSHVVCRSGLSSHTQ